VAELPIIVVLVAGAAGVMAALGRRVLLGWYLREIRSVKVPEDPGDKIVTYPLA
jgi:hypothetical protein